MNIITMANYTVNRFSRAFVSRRDQDRSYVTQKELHRLTDKAMFANTARAKLILLEAELLAFERKNMTRLQRRNLRDLERRISAVSKASEIYKQESQFRRDISVSLSKKAKQTERHQALFGEPEEAESQSGLLMGAAAAAGATALGIAGMNASKDIKRGVDAIVGIADRLESPIADACDGISYISGKMQGGSPLTLVADYIKKSLLELQTKLLQWWKPICALIFIGLFVAYSSISWFGVMLSGLFSSMMPDVYGYVSHFFEGDEAQSQGSIDLLSYAATVGCCAFVPTRDPATMVGEIMRRVGSADRSMSGFTSIIEKGITYLEKVVNCILRFFQKDEVKWSSQLDNILSQWSTKVDAFEKICVTGNPSMADLQQAMALMQEGVGLRQVIKSAPNAMFLSKYMDRLGGAIAAHRGALSAGNSFRMPPLTAMLGGESGVGKTTVLKWLASSIMLLTGAVPAEEVLNNMWQKGLSEFWNGYVQQFCYIMDDCFQQKTDGSQLDNEAMFLIRAVGNWAFPLNFADVDSKGRFYFNSPLIMGTTNVANIKDFVNNLVAEPTAVVRRIEYGYWVFVHKDFQKGTGILPKALDYNKIEAYYHEKINALTAPYTKEQLLDCIPWHAWQLAPHDFSGAPPSIPSEDSFTLLDLAKEMSDEYTRRSARHTSEVKDLQSWATKLAGGLTSQSGLSSDEEYTDVLEGIYQYGYSSDDSTDTPLPSEETCLKMIHEAQLERERMTIERKSWIAKAMEGVSNFFSKHTPLIGDVMSFVIDPLRSFDDKSMAAWARRLLSFGIIAMVFGALTLFLKGVLDLTAMVLRKLFGAKVQSNVTSQLSRAGKNDIRLARLQSSLDPTEPKDTVVNICYNNTYKILIERSGAYDVLGQVLFIEGNLAMMPYHFWKQMNALPKQEEIHVLMISAYMPSVRMKVPLRDFLAQQTSIVPDSDIMFVKVDNRMLKVHRSITHFFMPEDSLKSLFRNTRNEVRLDVAKVDADLNVSKTTYVSGVCEYVPEGVPVHGMGTLHGLCKYTAPTATGDCGAPLSLFDAKFHGGTGLVGVHVAGKTGLLSRCGYAVVVSRELVVEARSHLSTWTDPFTFDMQQRRGISITHLTPSEEQMLSQAGIISGSFIPIGKVDQPVNIAMKSKIKSSPFKEMELFGPAPMAPAILRPVVKDGEAVYPMARAMEAYQSDVEFRHVKNMAAIVEMATKPFTEATQGYDKSILTFEEAVAPPPHLKLKPINRKTSPGYPYKLGAGPGKSDWFGKTGDFDFSSEECAQLRVDVEMMIAGCKEGVRPSVVCMDFLKDELRPLEKVKNVQTRAISGSPLDYVVTVRMYYGTFMAAMFATCVENGMAPGINPYSDWHALAEKLTEKGPKVFAGDFSRFDASEQPYIHTEILAYINRWYRMNNAGWKLEDDKVREMLWIDLIHSRHLTGTGCMLDIVVQWNKSLPSGHPLTTMVNSFYSLITLTACYAHLTSDYKDMWDHVFINTFGDDNVVGADDATIEVFNQKTVSQAMKELFNLTYTSDKKGSELVEYESIHDITFLKRSFVRDDMANGGWIAPLDPKSFLYTPYWFKNPRDVVGDLTRNVEQMLSELSLHEPSKWEEYYPLVEKFFYEEGMAVPFRTRDAAYQWVQSRNDAWY